MNFMSDKIDSILEERQKRQAGDSGDQLFYQMVRVDGSEFFFEIRFRNGIHTAFKYDDLSWFNYDPERGIDMSFAGNTVTIEGRGLFPTLFDALKNKKISWIREADTEMQDTPEHPLFIKDITITPVDDLGAEEQDES